MQAKQKNCLTACATSRHPETIFLGVAVFTFCTHARISFELPVAELFAMSLASRNPQGSSVQFVVDNTYRRLPLSEARLDRSGSFRKVHDWTLFLDVLHGDPDLIERVTFDLGPNFASSYICACPVQVQQSNGRVAWRFSTRQQSHGRVSWPRTLTIRGVGGSILKVTHQLETTSMTKGEIMIFSEHRPIRPLKFLKVPEQFQFGIELELTSATHLSPGYIASELERSARLAVDAIDYYGHGRETSTNWKIVPDSSIMCGPSLPDCNTLELVSPILIGGVGLTQTSAILKGLGAIRPSIKVNKSMGFHVHVDVSSLTHNQLVKVCQNFVKYEAAMDTFMPLSRRTGSPQSDQYFQSNRRSVSHDNVLTNRQCLTGLAACADLTSLVHMMNAHGRYYKLNMQNLITGRQPTIEFRQHSATANYEKVSAWVRFCLLFVANAAKLQAPKAFKQSRSVDEHFEALFQFVIKDRALRNYYRNRRISLQQGGDDDDEGNGACCTGCSSGGVCAARKRPYNAHSY